MEGFESKTDSGILDTYWIKREAKTTIRNSLNQSSTIISPEYNKKESTQERH